jgi:hypothetical protein
VNEDRTTWTSMIRKPDSPPKTHKKWIWLTDSD